MEIQPGPSTVTTIYKSLYIKDEDAELSQLEAIEALPNEDIEVDLSSINSEDIGDRSARLELLAQEHQKGLQQAEDVLKILENEPVPDDLEPDGYSDYEPEYFSELEEDIYASSEEDTNVLVETRKSLQY